jgi:hypothetical protein
MGTDLDKRIAAKGRHVSLVIAVTMCLWIGANFAGPALGLQGKFALLFDFAALTALVYAGVNIIQLWRLRQDSQG